MIGSREVSNVPFSAGIGTPQHVSGELFKMMTGANLVHVPDRGAGPMLIDLLGGQVQTTIDPLLSLIEYVRSRRLRALAATTTTRSEALPDLPISVPVCRAPGRLVPSSAPH